MVKERSRLPPWVPAMSLVQFLFCLRWWWVHTKPFWDTLFICWTQLQFSLCILITASPHLQFLLCMVICASCVPEPSWGEGRIRGGGEERLLISLNHSYQILRCPKIAQKVTQDKDVGLRKALSSPSRIIFSDRITLFCWVFETFFCFSFLVSYNESFNSWLTLCLRITLEIGVGCFDSSSQLTILYVKN